MTEEQAEFIRTRIFSRIKVNSVTGCWEWTGYTQKGYGACSYLGKEYKVHRLMYELYKGPIPTGLYICHTCDVPACCNPEHLWAGTNAENMQDAGRKGRLGTTRFKTHCKRGHEFTPENTLISSVGSRNCRMCAKERKNKHNLKKAECCG